MTQLAGTPPRLQGFVEQVLFMERKPALPKLGCLAAAFWSRLRRRIVGRGAHGSRIASL
jgi:hypothetical protein